jgi:hypothetical protein
MTVSPLALLLDIEFPAKCTINVVTLIRCYDGNINKIICQLFVLSQIPRILKNHLDAFADGWHGLDFWALTGPSPVRAIFCGRTSEKAGPTPRTDQQRVGPIIGRRASKPLISTKYQLHNKLNINSNHPLLCRPVSYQSNAFAKEVLYTLKPSQLLFTPRYTRQLPPVTTLAWLRIFRRPSATLSL